jgi:hypothetical protein
MENNSKIDLNNNIKIFKCSFITNFSGPFLNRQNQLSYVAKTALFKEDFTFNIQSLNSRMTCVYKEKRTMVFFIYPSAKRLLELMPEAKEDHDYDCGVISFIFLSMDNFVQCVLNKELQQSKTKYIFIFVDFKCWHDIVSDIFNISYRTTNSAIVISGGDTSKRHLVNDISIKLHYFLFLLANGDEDFLVRNVIFNLDKKYLAPKFCVKSTDRDNYGVLRNEPKMLADKNKKSKGTSDLKDLVTQEAKTST